MAFTLETETASGARERVAVEHEVFAYFDALHAAGVPGGAALNRFDEWADRRYSPADALAFAGELQQAHDFLSAAFARDTDAVPEPPERIGLDDSEEGVPFGRDGFLSLLHDLLGVFRRASEGGQRVLANGD